MVAYCFAFSFTTRNSREGYDLCGFPLIIIINIFVESMFETQAGVMFFAFLMQYFL